MKTTSLLVAALLAAGLPIYAMQPPADAAPPAATPDSSTAMSQPAGLKPVNGELISKLDAQTAKTGDNVVIETKSAVKTADGTEIPKGSKLTGHVVAVQQTTGDSPNSQVAVNIDKAELKGGQTLRIHTEIQSLGTADAAGDSAPTAIPRSSASGSSNSSGSNAANSANAPGYSPGNTPGTNGSAAPSPGTIVARNGHIAIRTTSMPGILLANNAPGEQDPRMEQASGILLGAKKNVQLDSGTKVVLGVAAAGAVAPADAAATANGAH